MICIQPAETGRRQKRSTANALTHLDVIDRWRRDILFFKCARSQEKPLTRAGDHSVAWREMLKAPVAKRPHAFDDGVILHGNALDARKTGGSLQIAIKVEIILHARYAAKPPVPIRRIRKKLH